MSKPAPQTPDSPLAARLRAVEGGLTKSEAMIAQWLMLNEGGLPLETGASIAAKTGVSEITVSRFLRRLGFRGMTELKAEIGSPAALHIHATDRYIRLLEGELGTLLKRDADACPVRRIPAAEIESAVIEQVRVLLRSPEVIVRTWRVARRSLEGLREADVREALERLDPFWDELFPAEQARIVQLLVERVDIGTEGADIRLRTQGLTSLIADLSAIQPENRRAA